MIERRLQRKTDEFFLEPVVTPEVFSAMRQMVEDVFVHPDVERYIVGLAAKTRNHPKIVIGVSPRGSLALVKITRAWAAIQGRNYVLPDDIKRFAQDAFSHRIILEPSLWGSRTTEKSVINEIVHSVAVPVIPFEHE
jgi:MoxR-like ATPase